MSDLVTKLRDLDEKATRAPWEQGVYDGGTLFRGDGAFIEFPPAPNVVPDVRAIVALRNALPALIEYVEAAQELRDWSRGAGWGVLAVLRTRYDAAKERLLAALEGRHE